MLKGKAKTDYQRKYMREYRLKKSNVRPSELDPYEVVVHQEGYVIGSARGGVKTIGYDAEGNPIYEEA